MKYMKCSPRLRHRDQWVADGILCGLGARTLKESVPSVISIAWSAARSRKVWVVLLVGQETVSAATRFASTRPIVSTRLLPPKLPLLPIVR